MTGHYDRDRDAVRRALLRQMREGVDVGAFLVDCVRAATEQAWREGGDLIVNRPGSWEANLLRRMIEASGAGERADVL